MVPHGDRHIEAERDERTIRLHQKISDGFRAANGARDFAITGSVIATARKQGWNISGTLMTAPDLMAGTLRY